MQQSPFHYIFYFSKNHLKAFKNTKKISLTATKKSYILKTRLSETKTQQMVFDVSEFLHSASYTCPYTYLITC